MATTNNNTENNMARDLDIKDFIFTVNHDKGTETIKVAAYTEEQARELAEADVAFWRVNAVVAERVG